MGKRMTFSKYLSGLMENISYPPKSIKDKKTGQLVFRFKN